MRRSSSRASGSVVGEAVTDAYGEFKIEGLKPDSGRYRVVIEVAGREAKRLDARAAEERLPRQNRSGGLTGIAQATFVTRTVNEASLAGRFHQIAVCRVTKSCAADEQGIVEGQTRFPDGSVFTFALESLESKSDASASYTRDRLVVKLPARDISAWAKDERPFRCTARLRVASRRPSEATRREGLQVRIAARRRRPIEPVPKSRARLLRSGGLGDRRRCEAARHAGADWTAWVPVRRQSVKSMR